MLEEKALKKLNETTRLIQKSRSGYQSSIFIESQVKTKLDTVVPATGSR
jgi:hypothetical protein|tara:strand:+ start:514 stop:660 length:147 start_codon:yes stop_codon:yes gene_type:complete